MKSMTLRDSDSITVCFIKLRRIYIERKAPRRFDRENEVFLAKASNVQGTLPGIEHLLSNLVFTPFL